MTASHETRIDVALALGGWVTFCSCGRLTGFADTAAGAEKISANHKAKVEQEEHMRLCDEARSLGIPTSLEDPRSPTTVQGLRDAIASASTAR